MKRILFLATFFLISSQLYAQTISQPAGTFFRFAPDGFGQSFTATQTTTIERIEFASSTSFGSGSAIPIWFFDDVSQITGNLSTLTPVYVDTFNKVTNGSACLTLKTPFPVVAGQQYGFIIPTNPSSAARAATGDPYAGGQLYTITSGGTINTFPSLDLTFEIWEGSASLPSITLQADTASCTPVTISGSTGFNSYTWNNGANTTNITANTSGNYILTVTDADNCIAVDSVMVTINDCIDEQTLTANPTAICAGDSTIITMGGSELGIEYSLRNDSDSSLVGMPMIGTGNSMDFGTGSLTTNTTYHMYAERSGTALDFDAIDDRVELSPSPSLSGDFTVMFWLKTTNNVGRAIAWGEASGVNRYTTIGTYFNKLSFYTGNGSGGNTRVSSSSNVNDGMWHHIAVTRNSATDQITIYVDGIQDGQGTAANISTNLANATLGSGFINGSYQGDLDGTLDDLSVWGAELSTTQIQNSMMSGVSSSATNLRAYYDFESAAGTTVVDRSGNGQTGTMVNMDPANDWVKGITVERRILSARASVTVNALPAVQANASAMSVCNGESVTLTGAGATTYTWDNSVVDGTAFTPSATMTYNVTGTDGNNCENTASVQVMVNALPAVQANASAMSVCNGESVTLTGAGATTYIWDNSVVDGTAFTPSATMTYNVTGTDGNNCENTASVQVMVNALPTVQANASAMSVCNGDQVTLTGAGATTYIWDNSVVDGTAFTPSGTMTYNVTGTDGNNCENTASVQVMVNALPTVQANASAMSVCNGDQVTLTGAGATTYIWDNSVVDGTAFTPSGTMTYNVTGTDGNNCENTASVQVMVAAPLDTAITTNSTSLSAVATGVSYQWIDCGQNNAPIFGMTNQTFTPSVSGSYAVIVSDGTCSDTSSCINFVLSNIAEIAAQDVFTIYPNPNQGRFTVVFQQSNASENRIEIVNVTGQIIQSLQTNNLETTIDLNAIAKGMYFVRVNGQYTQKMIVTD